MGSKQQLGRMEWVALRVGLNPFSAALFAAIGLCCSELL